MTSMLTRIEQQLAQCSDPDRRAELQAERASYLARTGHFAEANEILATLRKVYGDGRNARVSVWIMFVEGLVLYFERVSAGSRDRIFRARAICAALGIGDLYSLATAWLAHLDFERSEYERVGNLLAEILANKEPIGIEARSRVAMILGDAFLYIGDRVKSQIWFELCRRYAVDLGDRATLGALMYNRSAFGLARIRVEYFVQGKPMLPSDLRIVDMELASAEAFQVGTGVVSLVHIVNLSRARVLMLRGQFKQAIDIFVLLNETLGTLEDRKNHSSVIADLGLCLLCSEMPEAASKMLDMIKLIDIEALDPDDRLVALAMAIKISDALGFDSRRSEFEAEMPRMIGDYEAEQARLRKVLGQAAFGELPVSW